MEWRLFRSFRPIRFTEEDLQGSSIGFKQDIRIHTLGTDDLVWQELSHRETAKFKLLITGDSAGGSVVLCRGYDSMDQMVLDWIQEQCKVVIHAVQLRHNLDPIFQLINHMDKVSFSLKTNDIFDNNLNEIKFDIVHDGRSDILARIYDETGFRKEMFYKYLSHLQLQQNPDIKFGIDINRNEFVSRDERLLVKTVLEYKIFK